MAGETLAVALLTETFHDREGPDRLRLRLGQARTKGAELAVLPELPLHPWFPASRDPRPDAADPPGVGRERRLAEAAAAEGIAVVGGAVVEDPQTGRRYNEGLLFDHRGELLQRYRKTHLPREEGFWEAEHYDAGSDLPIPVPVLGFPVGVQVCSDVYRPSGCQLLALEGARAILLPRATPGESWDRWRMVLRTVALISGAYLISVNRPEPEPGVPIGGPSVVVAPDGEVLLETVDPVAVVLLEAERVRAARNTYPGYLAVRDDLYARGWARARPGAAPGGAPAGEGSP